ncbi:hypothetical protein METUNv1_02348 [Methyloversatilis universalis FAM5]|uniref:PEP-CTERM protein-sorting domain-containing protein n=1 Tax=Methyloversatilis universalis (strain ATCC BAA-1314 / DSM 25237 / JCM 13912 / CCUG 52030 / FAM5) TaxID=1000565 RepID=F5RDI1_METUF|nr:hypothetical protein [Methyloversatilis universalis]EGK70962.1 hypothetical protein METUNv1_02348 [Methyloversatilis universalis FAM5]
MRVLALAGLLAALPLHAETLIDLTPESVTGPNHVRYRAQCCVVSDRPDFTPPISGSMGVTFRPTGSDLWLEDFSLFLRQRTDITGQLSGYTNSGGTMNFRAFIGSWGYRSGLPAGASGDLIEVLWTSAVTTTVHSGDIQKFTFEPGLQLAANQWYFAFISPEGLPLQPLRTYEMPVSYDGNPAVTTSPNLWMYTSPDDFNALLTGNWTAGWGPAWFEATLQAGPPAIPAVPEADGRAMLLTGLGMLAAVNARRRAVRV